MDFSSSTLRATLLPQEKAKPPEKSLTFLGSFKDLRLQGKTSPLKLGGATDLMSRSGDLPSGDRGPEPGTARDTHVATPASCRRLRGDGSVSESAGGHSLDLLGPCQVLGRKSPERASLGSDGRVDGARGRGGEGQSLRNTHRASSGQAGSPAGRGVSPKPYRTLFMGLKPQQT